MSTIEKIAVYDARIIQEAPKYGVQKGALAISVSPFNALSATNNTMQFQVLVPSLNVFVDRKVDLLTGANVYAEAVPSQYSSLSYAQNAGADSLDSACSMYNAAGVITTDAACPTANAVFNIEQSLLPSYVDGSVVAGSTIGPFAPLSLGFSSFIVTATASTATFAVTGRWVAGINPSIAAGLAFLTGTVGSGGNGVTDNTVLSVVNPNGLTPGAFAANSFTLTASGSNWVFTTGGSTVHTAAFNVGDVITINNRFIVGQVGSAGTVAVTGGYKILKTVPFMAHNLTGESRPSSQFLRCYVSLPIAVTGASTTNQPWGLWGGFSKSSAAYPISTPSGYIALPQLESTPDKLVLPQEVIKANGDRGFGINSGFRLVKGAFKGCLGPTDCNWYQPIGGAQDVTLSMFPVQSLCSSIVAQVNDCSVNINGDVLKEQILLSQTRSSLMQRTTNSKFDVYSWSIDDVRNANGATQTYGSAKDSDIGNGSWKVEYINPNTGVALKRFDWYDYNGVRVFAINYKPAFIPLGSTLVGMALDDGTVITESLMATPLPVMFRYYVSEPLCISPFLWQDAKEMTECGIYGCTNIQFTLNLQPAGPTIGYQKITTGADGKKVYADKLNNLYPTNAAIMRASGLHALFGKVALQAPTQTTTSLTGPWIQPRVMVTFLTPPPDVTLPLVSTVPYMEFPRYFSPASLDTGGKNSTFYISSNTVTLSSIPDLLAVFVKPTVRGQTQNECYLPIEQIGVTFDNYSNLCSNFAQEDLYACTAAAGLDMDWQQWRGYTTSLTPTGIPISSTSGDPTWLDCRDTTQVTQLTGGPLLLRMGQDIPLSPGLAPGTLGNFSVQLNIRVDNRHGFFNYLTDLSQSNNATIIIMAVNSGFFETVRGQSAVRKTILNSVDVEAASTQAGITSSHLKRLIGAGSGVGTSSGIDRAMNAADAARNYEEPSGITS